MQTVRDSIHRNIDLSDWALDLIDTKEMQRLRRVRQLGTAHLVYPGANHSRFEHSLGAYHLAGDASRALELDPDDATLVAAAALLHDLGHGPLSHLFEEVLKGRNRRHEEFSADLIQWSTIGDRLGRHDIPAADVAQLVLGRHRLSRIVAGDIDVDRMDYLLRDAHYTGLRTAVDPERLLSQMAWHEGRYVVRSGGVTAAEGLLMTRFLMYPSVYFHHTCRAAESMVAAGIEDLLSHGEDVEALRTLDDAALMRRLADGTPVAADAARRFRERRLFKRAWEGTARDFSGDGPLGSAIDDVSARQRLRDEVADEAGVDTSSVLFDVPRTPLLREVGAGVLRPDGQVVALTEASTLVRNLLAAQMDHWRAWVFARPQDTPAVEAAAARVLSREPQKG